MTNTNTNQVVDLIEVQIQNGAVTEFRIGDSKDINDSTKIISIETFKQSALSHTHNGFPVVNDNVFNKSFIMLVNRNDQKLRYMTLASLSKIANGTTIKDLNLTGVDLQKSKIKIGNSVGVVAGEVFLLQITYEK
jgi:hypothetical protein